MQSNDLTFDAFSMGQELPIHVHTVTSAEIDNWCRMLGESNPVYLNDEDARKAGFDGRIAPPMMVRVFAHMQNVFQEFHRQIPAHSIHVKGRYRFLKEVRPGDTITTAGTVTEKYTKDNRKYLTFHFKSKNQNGVIVVENTHTSIWPK